MFFIQTFWGIIIHPYIEFQELKKYEGSYFNIIKDFLIYVSLINIILSIVKIYIYGPYKGYSLSNSILQATLFNIMGIITIYIAAKVIDYFAPRFNCERDFHVALKIASFCSVNTIIGNIINLTGIKVLYIIPVIYLVLLRYYSISVLYDCKNKIIFYALIPEFLLIILAILLIATGFILQQIFFI